MTANTRVRRKALATLFVKAAGRYWLSVFPHIRHESHHWRQRAERIPDPILRHLALEAQQIKRGNIEGSAAFAVFAPAARVATRCALKSHSNPPTTTLTSSPSSQAHHPVANSRCLHQALLDTLGQDTGQPDYYARFSQHDDGGYLEQIVDACRTALNSLPSRTSIRPRPPAESPSESSPTRASISASPKAAIAISNGGLWAKRP